MTNSNSLIKEKISINDQLRDLIKTYFNQHPRVSINGLAKRVGVGATTIRRILQSSIKEGPAPHTILNIVSAIYKEKNLGKLLNLLDGPVGECLRENFNAFVSVQTEYTYSHDLNVVLNDKVNYLIYKLAANQSGTTKEAIKDMFGDLGLGRVKELSEIGLLLINDKGIIHAKEKNFSLDVGIAKKHLPELVRFFKPEEVVKGLNIFYTLSESLSEKGIQEVKRIQREAVQKIHQVLSESKFQGDIPYFTINLSETLTVSKSDKEGL